MEMDEQEFLAAAADHDAQAIAASVGAQVTSDLRQFLNAIHNAAARQAIREADPRSARQIADEMGRLHQRFLDAWWHGTPEQTRQAARAFARAMEHPSTDQLYVHAASVQVGDYVRAVGYDPYGGRDAATGVIEDIDYTERVLDPYGYGQPDIRYGFAFTLVPVVRADRPTYPVDIWVWESGSPDVLRLPTPADHGQPAGLADPAIAPAAHRTERPATHPAALARSLDPPGAASTVPPPTPAPDADHRPARPHADHRGGSATSPRKRS